MNNFETFHMKKGHTLAKVVPDDLSAEEHALIAEGKLGYCEAHHNLYRRVTLETMENGIGYGLMECPIQSVCCKCPDPTHHPKIGDFTPCKEWTK